MFVYNTNKHNPSYFIDNQMWTFYLSMDTFFYLSTADKTQFGTLQER